MSSFYRMPCPTFLLFDGQKSVDALMGVRPIQKHWSVGSIYQSLRFKVVRGLCGPLISILGSMKPHTLWKHPVSYLYSHTCIPQLLPLHLHQWSHQWSPRSIPLKWPIKRFLISWPTYKLDQDILPLDFYAKNQVCMSVSLDVRARHTMLKLLKPSLTRV